MSRKLLGVGEGGGSDIPVIQWLQTVMTPLFWRWKETGLSMDLRLPSLGETLFQLDIKNDWSLVTIAL